MVTKTLYCSEANDSVQIGSSGWDASDNYTVYTDGSADTIKFFIDGVSEIYAGTGNDTITANGSGGGWVFGEDGEDKITQEANSLDDGELWLSGGAGNDLIQGLKGASDTLVGGTGNDDLFVEEGNIAYGGAGDGTCYLRDAWDTSDTGGTVVEYAGGGFDRVIGMLNAFNFGTSGIEAYTAEMNAPSRHTVITGNDLDNSASTTGGNDTLDGGHGGFSGATATIS